MKTVYILGQEIADRAALHAALAQQLTFPDYYGENLDSLYDVLCTQAEPCCIMIQNREALQVHLGEYCRRFLRVLLDASLENSNISITL